jgi:hypothetical protein
MDCVEALDRHILARRIPIVAGHRQSKIRHRIYEMQYLGRRIRWAEGNRRRLQRCSRDWLAEYTEAAGVQLEWIHEA